MSELTKEQIALDKEVAKHNLGINYIMGGRFLQYIAALEASRAECSELREKLIQTQRERFHDEVAALTERAEKAEAQSKRLRGEQDAIKRYLSIPDSLEALCCIERCVYSSNTKAEKLLDGPPSTLRERVAALEKELADAKALVKSAVKLYETAELNSDKTFEVSADAMACLRDSLKPVCLSPLLASSPSEVAKLRDDFAKCPAIAWAAYSASQENGCDGNAASDALFSALTAHVDAALSPSPAANAVTTSVCPDCGGDGVLGRVPDGRLIACERCGGHEDSCGTGTISVAANAEKDQATDAEALWRRIFTAENHVKSLSLINDNLRGKLKFYTDAEMRGEPTEYEKAVAEAKEKIIAQVLNWRQCVGNRSVFLDDKTAADIDALLSLTTNTESPR